jgi:hypothetical protein
VAGLLTLALATAVGGAPRALADHGGGGGGGGGGGAAPDFVLSANYAPPSFTGMLVRGAIPGSPCGQCNGGGLPQPAYVVPDPLGCTYDWNQISVISLNGFQGTITLTLLNLPAGVTSLTPTSLSLPQPGATSTPFKLQASSTSALGGATVTIRATSGAIVHTLGLPISVSDQLPLCQ